MLRGHDNANKSATLCLGFGHVTGANVTGVAAFAAMLDNKAKTEE
jgi:hypothetical protein